MYTIKNHLLKNDNVIVDLVPNKDSGVFKELDTLIAHYTAGHTTKSAYDTLKDPKKEACAHLILGRDGKWIQLVPFNMITWHAGESKWRDRVGINKYSIGIEIVNAGPLERTSAGYKTWYGSIIPTSEVIKAKHVNEKVERYWQTYTEEQISEFIKVTKLLKETYNLKYLLGHSDIAPTRKTDPGPAFPIDNIRSNIFSGNRKDIKPLPKSGVVNTDQLNVRLEPSISSPPICILMGGKTVQITDQTDEYYEINLTGFVKKEFIE